jgi:anhydro-N-acetylmuramic acid kinase
MTWQSLFADAERSPRYIIGLMSGTSADGTDAALVRFDGQTAELVAFAFVPFADDLRKRILGVSHGQGNAEIVSRLSVELAVQYADAVQAVYSSATLPDSERVLAIGCHGQTVSHTPHGAFPATLQLGDAATLATRTRIPVVSNFRSADVALGGQGAPLVPYVDWWLLGHLTKKRALQNIGGIGNVTYLPAGGAASDVRGFDTGPGNMLIDHLAGWATEGRLRFDEDGAIARLGTVQQHLMNWLFEHPFLQLSPPKSAGREEFGTNLAGEIQQFATRFHMRPADVLATVTAFTAYSIASAYDRFLPDLPDEVIVSGGGARNPVLMQFLREKLDPIPVLTSDEMGINAEAREAIAFAVLADATLRGVPASLPAVTGARRSALAGSVTLPG